MDSEVTSHLHNKGAKMSILHYLSQISPLSSVLAGKMMFHYWQSITRSASQSVASQAMHHQVSSLPGGCVWLRSAATLVQH